MSQPGAAMLADPLRMYIVTLRKGRQISQEALATAIGVYPGTYIAWESGKTKTLKNNLAQKIIAALDGSPNHYARINQVNAEEARLLAEEWLKLSPEERAAAEHTHYSLRRIIELSLDEPEGLERTVELLREAARDDPSSLQLIEGVLLGLGVSRNRRG